MNMNTNPVVFRYLTALSATIFFIVTACGQPAGPRINPVTGMPETSAAQPTPPINPATGLPETSAAQPGVSAPAFGTEQFKPDTALQASCTTATEVHQLISSGLYEDALQRCVAFHDQYKTSASLIPLLNDWIELGRRYPKAKEALLKIRDDDTSEFAAGRGYFELFSEVNSINGYLHQDDATYKLFKSFRDKDPNLAGQCYAFVEGLLVAKGEYQWCYDHMGDPQGKFESIHQSMTMRLDNQKRMAAMNNANRERIAELNHQHGWTNLPVFAPPDTSAMIKRSAENGFVGQTRQLIEILVATGHKGEAEKIRAEALTVLDDDRLKSAVEDAEAKVKK
jgi:hypothetical protein